jgi:hypothetical protein
VARRGSPGWHRKSNTEQKNTVMIRNTIYTLLLSFLVTLTIHHALGADDSALLDALVRKGVLTDKEAEEISTEAIKETAGVTAGKIQIGDWVQELKLSGDFRLRNQWDEHTPMVLTNPALKNQDTDIPRDRWRFRLRLNLDFKLVGNFFGGVQLTTSDNRNGDTGNATYTGGYDNYNIYISRAFMGWQPEPALTFVAGKQANPFYTTDLFWSPDDNPGGLVERIDFHKLFNMTFGEPVAEGKGNVAAPPPENPKYALEATLIAGQFVFFNNNLDASNTQLTWDAYQFETQLLTRLKIGKDLTITVAPALFITNDASVGSNAVLANGNLNPGSVPSVSGTAAQNNAQPFPITQRDEFIVLAPGDITYNFFGKPLSVYWDFAYNALGNDRFNKDYGPLFSSYSFLTPKSTTPTFSHPWQPSISDSLAWLVGLRYGQNKKAGDFLVSADYRQIGVAATDPNINTDDFSLSNMNTEGFEFRLAYNLTDFLTISLTGYISDALTKNLYGGYATGNVPGVTTQFPIARDRHDKVFQADLSMKF